MDAADKAPEQRVLVLAPTERDADLSRVILNQAGMTSALCPDLETLCRELAVGAGAAVLTEEALNDDAATLLGEVLGQQPPWSDFPILVLTRGGADSRAATDAVETLGNVTLLERPVRVATLVSALRAALRARNRQYQIREHLAERARAEQALREADRRKDEFLAMLGHELRNPLSPVRNALQILRLRCDHDPLVSRMATLMERQVGHMVRLVDDLLDVSRITRGKIELRRERVNLAVVAARTVEDVGPFLEERRHRLHVELPAEPVWVWADAARLEQILANLLNNAGKYTEPGGQIWLKVAREGNEAVVRVRDTGIGIRREVLPQLFQIFVQADRLPGRVGEGLGLGLTLSRSLVEMHGGTVAAFSEGPGRGSEFVIRLPPLSEVTAAPAAGGSAAEGRDGCPEPMRILVVDDNLDGAESLAMLLRLQGHQVQVAHDGVTALEIVRDFRPAVALLDIGLPRGMDGYELARRLRQRPELEATFLVALTGYGQEEDRRRSSAAGFEAHLVKPVDPQALLDLLAQLQGC